MKKILPWIVGFGILAIVLLIGANIYDSIAEQEALKEEPAWIEPDSTVVLGTAVDDRD